MAFTVRRIDYFYIMVRDSPGIAYEVLSKLAKQGVNLVAITAVPFGPARTQLTVFPDDTAKMQRAAQQASLQLDGPHAALVVQGDDEVGALAQSTRSWSAPTFTCPPPPEWPMVEAATATSFTSIPTSTSGPPRCWTSDGWQSTVAPFRGRENWEINGRELLLLMCGIIRSLHIACERHEPASSIS